MLIGDIHTCQSNYADSLFLSPFRYGFPAAIVGISVVVSEVLYDTTRYGTENFCWLTHHGGFTFAFVGPVIVILFLNVVFLVIAMYQVEAVLL